MHAMTTQATATVNTTEPASFKVLGVRVDAVQIPDAVRILEQWIAARTGSRYVAVTGMHGVSESLVDKPFRAMLDAASMVVSDGMPLVWLGRWHGYKNMGRRVYGP
jgi:N-acetylglucosaminyldiphosphoundecaprenol N-acetyl-beta-D-mannosaminyltransferase